MDEQLKLTDTGTIVPIVIDPVTGKEDEFLPDDNFSYKGYQVTREEFFSFTREPALCFSGNAMYTNKVCLKKAPDATRVQILINPDQKKLMLKPCSEELKNAIPWMTAKGSIRRIICKDAFCAMITELTGWDLNNRYKLIGKMIRDTRTGDRYFQFDLKSALFYPRKALMDESGNTIKYKFNREPVYMESWKHQFGLPVDEHERTYQISRFDGYVAVSAQTPKRQQTARPQLNREDGNHGNNNT